MRNIILILLSIHFHLIKLIPSINVLPFKNQALYKCVLLNTVNTLIIIKFCEKGFITKESVKMHTHLKLLLNGLCIS